MQCEVSPGGWGEWLLLPNLPTLIVYRQKYVKATLSALLCLFFFTLINNEALTVNDVYIQGTIISLLTWKDIFINFEWVFFFQEHIH